MRFLLLSCAFKCFFCAYCVSSTVIICPHGICFYDFMYRIIKSTSSHTLFVSDFMYRVIKSTSSNNPKVWYVDLGR